MENKKSEISTTDNTNLSSISSVINIILSAFKIPRKPLESLPPPFLITGANLRSGITPSAIAARIISRQSEAGLVVGDVFKDGPNTSEQMELIRIEEIVNALLNDAKIEIAIPPGVQVTTTGIGNLGVPVISQGATTSIASGVGVIR